MIHADPCILRQWNKSDIPCLLKYANNKNIADKLRNHFPHPYLQKHAEEWIDICESNKTSLFFAIEYNNEAIGGIGITKFNDVYENTGELGYWLAEPFWGKGFMTKCIKSLLNYTFNNTLLRRIQATPYSNNLASRRILEKTGFKQEGIRKEAVIKNNIILDEYIFAILKNDYIKKYNNI